MTALPGAAPHHVLRGVLLLIAAMGTFAVVDTIAKYLARTYPVPLVVWARYATQTLFMSPVMSVTVTMVISPGLMASVAGRAAATCPCAATRGRRPASGARRRTLPRPP